MLFHKFVLRDGKQGQINSGKLSTYQPGVKRIARYGHEKKNTKNDTKKELAVLPGSYGAKFKCNCSRRNLWDPLAFGLPDAGFDSCAMRFSWLDRLGAGPVEIDLSCIVSLLYAQVIVRRKNPSNRLNSTFSATRTTTHNISGKNTFFFDMNVHFSKFKNTNGHTVCGGPLWYKYPKYSKYKKKE